MPYQNLSDWNTIHLAYGYKASNDIKKIALESKQRQKVNRLYDVVSQQKGHKLLSYVEQAKIALTKNKNGLIALEDIGEGFHVSYDRVKFDTASQPDLERINASVNECLEQAGLKKGDIQTVIMTGGASEMPSILNIVSENFPQSPIISTNRMTSVGLGLGYDAKRKFGI